MATGQRPRKRGRGVAVAPWLSVLFGVYAVLAVASLWGFFAGIFSAALGLLVSIAVLTEQPVGRTRRVARVGFVLSALALAGAAAIALAILFVLEL